MSGDRSKTRRRYLWRNGRRHCHWCGKRLTMRPNARGALTVDHLIPLSRGGTHKRSNLVPACRDCNQQKGAHLWKP